MYSDCQLDAQDVIDGLDFFLARDPESDQEVRERMVRFGSIANMVLELPQSKEFHSDSCQKRLLERPVTEDLVVKGFRLVLRREPESRKVIEDKIEHISSQSVLIADINGSEEAQYLAKRFAFFASAEFNAEPKAIFLHVPKTAGKSFTELARNVYGDKAVIERARQFYPEASWCAASLVGGHLQYHQYERMTTKRVFVAVVRDPVERAISNFNFIRNEDARRGRSRADQGFDYDDLKRTIRDSPFRVEFIKNLQCRYLSGKRTFDGVMQSFERDAFIIGHFSNMEQWLSRVAKRLGWANADLPRVNMAPNPEYLESYRRDEELIDILTSGNREDQLLCDFIREQGVYESQGEDFDYSPFQP